MIYGLPKTAAFKIHRYHFSRQQAKIQEELMEKYMLPLECVSRIKWDGVAGENLRKARGKTSRRELAEMLNNQLKNPVPPLAPSYVQKLESNILETVPIEILQAVSVCLNVSIGEIIDVYRYL
jgi:hypothetical protein